MFYMTDDEREDRQEVKKDAQEVKKDAQEVKSLSTKNHQQRLEHIVKQPVGEIGVRNTLSGRTHTHTQTPTHTHTPPHTHAQTHTHTHTQALTQTPHHSSTVLLHFIAEIYISI